MNQLINEKKQTKQFAAIYIRVSTQDQVEKGFSLQAQEKALVSYAISLGYEVLNIYKDEGKSGKDIKGRPEMVQMLKDAELGLFSALLVYKLDRLSRSIIDSIAIMSKLKELKVDFISMQERFDTSTAMGNFVINLFSILAQMEREVISERVSFGMLEKAQQGGFITKAPMGYILVEKNLEIYEKEAEKVRDIFKEYLDQDIYVKDLAIKNGMTGAGMKKLLTNETYLGVTKFKNKSYIGQHKAIIDAETFARVQKKLRK